MSHENEVSLQLDVIARLLETCGYAIEVDYTGAVIIVWTDHWPVMVKVKSRKAKGKRQKAAEEE